MIFKAFPLKRSFNYSDSNFGISAELSFVVLDVGINEVKLLERIFNWEMPLKITVEPWEKGEENG